MSKKISLEDVAKKYNSINTIWNENDKWHLHQKEMIAEFIRDRLSDLSNLDTLKILNAGSAGFSYGLENDNILHVDIANEKISHLSNYIVSDIQKIPINEHFDVIICVGSVINYCDPILVLEEFQRLSNINTHLVLEFENSYTWELFGTSDFNKKAVFIKTFYNGKAESIWFFSESYIESLAQLYGFKLLKVNRCHLMSPLVYRFSKSESFAARFKVFDKILLKIPLLKRISSNVIFHLIREK